MEAYFSKISIIHFVKKNSLQKYKFIKPQNIPNKDLSITWLVKIIFKDWRKVVELNLILVRWKQIL